MKLERTVSIDSTSEKVWQVLVDVERWPEWTASMLEVAWLEGKTMEVGSRVRIKQPGMPALVWEVTELDPGTSFTWRASSPGVSSIGSHRITPVTANSVSVTFGLLQSGALAGLVGLVTKGRIGKYVQMEADGLKRRAESPE